MVLHRKNFAPARPACQRRVAAVLTLLVGLALGAAVGRAQPSYIDPQGAQVLTRGPVHEAFAGMVTFNPEPGIVVTKSPPDVIEEVPPAERPEGDNVAWIPGYWGWDDERNDFLWVSGTWRALPPGRAWIAGYWGQAGRNYQWISGYWADAAVRETTYLPPPPATVEAGPNIAAPNYDYTWMPGNWIWYQDRYAWRPGYWMQAQADWDWIPAHYIWTPRGYIYVEGFWDYPVERRGILFAPVYFSSSVYSRRGYSYSPMIVINLSLFSDQLFLRPRYQHYYFGDYYAPSYVQAGYYASYSFQTSRYGYDPFYSRQRWVHRQDREWEHSVEVSFQYRRDNVAARPPRTWAAQGSVTSAPQSRMMVATPIDQLVRSKDSPMRFQPVAKEERQQLVRRRQEVQTSREQRSSLEVRVEATGAQRSGAVAAPAKVQLPRSPIVAKPASQLGRNQAPPAAPRIELPVRQEGVERIAPQPAPRALEPEKNSPPRRGEVNVRERQAQQETEQRAKESAAKAQEETQRNARGMAQKAQQESERQARDAARAAEDSQRNVRATEAKAQQEAEQRAREAAKAQEEAQRNARATAQKAQQDSERAAREAPAMGRGKEKQKQKQPEQSPKSAAAKAQEEAQRKAKELEENAQKEAAAPATTDSPPPQPTKKGQENPGRGKGP